MCIAAFASTLRHNCGDGCNHVFVDVVSKGAAAPVCKGGWCCSLGSVASAGVDELVEWPPRGDGTEGGSQEGLERGDHEQQGVRREGCEL